MMKTNCWEFKNCGREIGGAKVKELGVCPAASAVKADQINNGKNGGRCCWALAGTLCGGKVQGIAALKLTSCMNCAFYQMVWKEEKGSANYKTPTEIIKILS